MIDMPGIMVSSFCGVRRFSAAFFFSFLSTPLGPQTGKTKAAEKRRTPKWSKS